ncbi:hypothetical protein L917_10751 [Phytophthora nicotianae]|uniref:Uncharacterized protein n=1 Tax=Phytophthora nicotianae TaxID=4792 RepID=W2GMB3_PHYNI|nr:hypothetical protein L915_10948 [Phytophthora nicotianae]ETL90602.1 hypothetical protein L917_10751 [Phytophthora nicotianae]
MLPFLRTKVLTTSVPVPPLRHQLKQLLVEVTSRGDQEFPPSNASPESNIALSSSRQAAWSLDMESTERAAAVATAGSAAIGTQSPPTPGDNGALNSEVEGNGVSGA